VSPDPASHLIGLLDGFAPADEIEAGHVRGLARLLATATDPFSRRHFEPGHVTASAFVVDPLSRRILLHHHRRLGRWLQMGGHVDEGEDVVNAALREAREESSLADLRLVTDRPFDIDVHAIPAGKGEPGHLHFDVRFLVSTARPDDAAMDLAESLDLAWLDFDEAERRMNAPESTRAIAKIRRLWIAD
jgi:8-oxo-dGTP pyrophosphatase MutT (NUDIX family)